MCRSPNHLLMRSARDDNNPPLFIHRPKWKLQSLLLSAGRNKRRAHSHRINSKIRQCVCDNAVLDGVDRILMTYDSLSIEPDHFQTPLPWKISGNGDTSSMEISVPRIRGPFSYLTLVFVKRMQLRTLEIMVRWYSMSCLVSFRKFLSDELRGQ